MKKLLSQLLTIAAVLLAQGVAQANGFSGAVSPPRFELQSQAGQVVRQSLEIYNMGNSNEQYNIKTNDWRLQGNNVSFSDALGAGSCRQWVKLERRKVSVHKGGKRNFRFEVHVPANTPAQECRFAIMVEGKTLAANRVAGNLNLPVNGRLAVIVYLSIGGAQPQLQVSNLRLSGGKAWIQVANKGNAHGRLQGTLAAKDGRGQALDLSVSSMPIMPGENRLLELTPHLRGKKHTAALQGPVNIKGDLYWSQGAFAIDTRI